MGVSSSSFQRTRFSPRLDWHCGSMEAIRVISTSTIQAENHIIGDKIHLNTWDLGSLPFGSIKRGLLFHKPSDTKDSPVQIQHLKDSLFSTLAFFPPLAGRLVILEHEQDNTTSSYIECNNAGALFVHAVAENTHVTDILRPKYVPPTVSSFFPLNGVGNHEGKPLLALQVTELADGIFVACTINHVAANDKSFWHFINSWAEISRGCHKNVSKPQYLNAGFPTALNLRYAFLSQRKRSNALKTLIQNRCLIDLPLTKEKIARLRSKANGEAGTDKISSLQALFTHLWCSVNRSKRVDPEEVVCYLVPIDVRPRMVPPLPDDYFGNAVTGGFATMRAVELLEGGVGKCALEMNKMIASHTDVKVRSDCESWLSTPRPLLHPRVFGGNVLMTSGSPRFDVYGNDFGWGKPVAVRTGGYTIEGVTTVFSGVEEGSIDIEVCLPYEILEALGNDPDFL